MSKPRITAVIVTYRSSDVIDAALDALKPAHDAGLLDCIVVDNASPDNTVAAVRQNHPWANIIESGGNLGYARGCNLGLARARTPYVLFMNPDLLITPDALQTLARFMDEHPHAAMAGPTLRSPDGRVHAPPIIETPWDMLRHSSGLGSHHHRIDDGRAAIETRWLCGAALFARRDAIERIGGFDPRFFLYFEETDLCRRLRRASGGAGETLWLVRDAVAVHHGAASASQNGDSMFAECIAQHYFQSRFYYLTKHYGRLAAATVDLAELAVFAVKGLIGVVRGRDDPRFHIRIRAPMLQCPPLGQ
jgi:N-acetylglucosaminyl-diphospho-decaprenol L-rhamnosyltransferase